LKLGGVLSGVLNAVLIELLNGEGVPLVVTPAGQVAGVLGLSSDKRIDANKSTIFVASSAAFLPGTTAPGTSWQGHLSSSSGHGEVRPGLSTP